MTAAIFGYDLKKESVPYVEELIAKLNELNISCLVHNDLYNLMKKLGLDVPVKCGFFDHKTELNNMADVVISLGGDGTFLNSVGIVKDSGIPVVGINLGRLGFLANISKDKIDEAIEAIFHKNYKVEERALIELKSHPDLDDRIALNEVCIQKSGPEMIKVQVYINGDYLNTYWSDGLLIATPTGSTAYSLSVGGPIIVPGAKNFVLSPISPHTLTVRPIIIPDNFELSLKVTSPSGKYIVALDHHSYEFTNEDEIILKRADFNLNLLKLDGMTFYKTLRDKLMWGVDRRN